MSRPQANPALVAALQRAGVASLTDLARRVDVEPATMWCYVARAHVGDDTAKRIGRVLGLSAGAVQALFARGRGPQ